MFSSAGGPRSGDAQLVLERDRPCGVATDRPKDDRTEPTGEIERPASAGPWLLEIASAEATEVVPLDEGRALVLGSGPRADHRLTDPTVSARHCEVRIGRAGVEVEDLGSKNGLRLGSACLRSLLFAGEGTSFVIGHTSITLRSRPADDDA